MSDFAGATVLITGGTGSFGHALAQTLLSGAVGEIRIFSRDEAKQDQMRRRLSDRRLRFYLGDIRDPGSVANATVGTDYVFHAAALKQVPSCEFFPLEAVRTNILGSNNVIEAAHNSKVQTVVCLSTDKAVYPLNAMGMSKALMEKAVQAFARNHPDSDTTLCVVRYGNVLYSRGSVVPLFIQQIMADSPVTVTDPLMTRFLMSLTEAVALVEYALTNAFPGDLFIKKAPACTIDTLLNALEVLFSVQVERTVLGIRHGEKLHETLATREELTRGIDEGEYWRIPLDARGLDYGLYFDHGDPRDVASEEFTSRSTTQLSVEAVRDLLAALPELAAAVASFRSRRLSVDGTSAHT